MTDEELCWEPIAALPEGEPEASFGGRWEDRLWLKAPGPFCTGITDNCWTGRLHAPRHVLYGGEYFSEYVYRRPATTAEVLNLVAAAQEDPYRGYACDGDSRWTPEAVRDWWRDRGRVTEYVESLLPGWSSGSSGERAVLAVDAPLRLCGGWRWGRDGGCCRGSDVAPVGCPLSG